MAHLEVRQCGNMMKTPVKWIICPFVIELLGTSCWENELLLPWKLKFTMFAQVSNQYPCKRGTSICDINSLLSRDNWDIFLFICLFLSLQPCALCYLSRAEWMGKKLLNLYPNLQKGSKLWCLTAVIYLWAFALWKFGPNLREFNVRGCSWDTFDIVKNWNVLRALCFRKKFV